MRGAEQVRALVDRAGAQHREHEVAHELLAQVARCARRDAPVRERLLADGLELLALADVGAEGDDLAAVGLVQPAQDDGGVEAAGVGEHDLLDASSLMTMSSDPVQRRGAMIAFWACRRFSAWSKTTLCGPSITVVGDLLAAVGGQAVHDQRVGARRRQQRLVHLVAARTPRSRCSRSASWPMLVHTSV